MIKEIKEPNNKDQTVIVVHENNIKERTEVYQDPNNNHYILINGQRIYFWELNNGDYLSQMMR